MNDARCIQLPVVFDAANRKKDRSLSIRMTTTQEISNKEFAEVDKSVGRMGFLLFAENAFDESDVPKEDAPGDRKSQGQRLRAVLFHCWNSNTDHTEDFEAYYRRRTEKLIEHFKQELD